MGGGGWGVHRHAAATLQPVNSSGTQCHGREVSLHTVCLYGLHRFVTMVHLQLCYVGRSRLVRLLICCHLVNCVALHPV